MQGGFGITVPLSGQEFWSHDGTVVIGGESMSCEVRPIGQVQRRNVA